MVPICVASFVSVRLGVAQHIRDEFIVIFPTKDLTTWRTNHFLGHLALPLRQPGADIARIVGTWGASTQQVVRGVALRFFLLDIK